MSKITISDLEVFYCVGVTDQEREKPQRLLITIEMSLDFTVAAVSDRIEKTINYQALSDEIIKYGEGRSWKLIEKLATNLADLILAQYKPQGVSVEIKKFPIPQAKYVSVTVTKLRPR
jgi:dihydroneopterin aldolase